LRDEAAQLPEDSTGVVVPDVSQVLGGLEGWPAVIQRRFQPKLHTRVSAVGLLETTLAEQGFVTNGEVLANPHAAKPLNAAVIEMLKGVVKD
jgi:hypothetical protein